MARPSHNRLPPSEPSTTKPPGDNSSDRSSWVSLGEASRLLGIAPGTLRRWADEGRIPYRGAGIAELVRTGEAVAQEVAVAVGAEVGGSR
ncbi:MAG: hypothetical protein C4343_04030 [Chloroflexota bacterium]